jgi:hypothetical protein
MGLLKQRLMVRLKELLRRSVRIFDWESNRDREYNFARRNIVGKGIRVLDIGGCDSLFPLYLARQSLRVTVMDFRSYHENHPNLTSIQGDFLKNNFMDNSFDTVSMISTIEHIGFGSYAAPLYQDGDFLAMAEVKRILNPTGRLVITFPFAEKHSIVPGFERWYDIDRAKLLFAGLHVLAEEYYIPGKKLLGKTVNFAPASLDDFQQVTCGCACYVVSKIPRLHF